MKEKQEITDRLESLRLLTLEDVEARIIEIEAERASLSVLRRSMSAKLAAQRRAVRRSLTQKESE